MYWVKSLVSEKKEVFQQHLSLYFAACVLNCCGLLTSSPTGRIQPPDSLDALQLELTSRRLAKLRGDFESYLDRAGFSYQEVLSFIQNLGLSLTHSLSLSLHMIKWQFVRILITLPYGRVFTIVDLRTSCGNNCCPVAISIYRGANASAGHVRQFCALAPYEIITASHSSLSSAASVFLLIRGLREQVQHASSPQVLHLPRPHSSHSPRCSAIGSCRSGKVIHRMGAHSQV